VNCISGFDLSLAKEIIFKQNKDNITFNILAKFDKCEFFYPRVYINKIEADFLTDSDN